MADAYEVALRWRGDLLRAELHQGAFEIWAGGTAAGDLPLPLEGRHLLVRSDSRGDVLLSGPAAAAWSLDGTARPGPAVTLGDSVARLQVADLEIAVQATSPPEPLPRWSIPAGMWRAVAAHVVAYCVLTFVLRQPVGAGQTAPARAPMARPVALRPFPDAGPPPHFMSRNDVSPPTSRARAPAPVLAPVSRQRRSAPQRRDRSSEGGMGANIAELATSSIEIASIDDLADPAERLGPCADSSCAGGVATGRLGRGDSPGAGAVGTCARAHFQGLVARHGRTAAIVACSPGPRLGSAAPGAGGESVVLRDQGPDARLAAEIWIWDGSSSRGSER